MEKNLVLLVLLDTNMAHVYIYTHIPRLNLITSHANEYWMVSENNIDN